MYFMTLAGDNGHAGSSSPLKRLSDIKLRTFCMTLTTSVWSRWLSFTLILAWHLDQHLPPVMYVLLLFVS